MVKRNISMRLDENLFRKINEDCQKWNMQRTEYIEEIIKGHYDRVPIVYSKKKKVTMF